MEAISFSGSTFHCKLCDVTFVWKSTLKKHLLTLRHNNGGIGQVFRCKICSKLLGSKCAASIHLKYIHKKKLKSCYKCSNCSSTFAKKSELITHSVVHIHKVRRDCHCPCCGKICSQRNNLMAHIRSHINEKPFSCLICDQSFKRRHKFIDHSCSATGSARSSTSARSSVSQPRIESNLRKHSKHPSNAQRTEMNTFSCDVCDKSFRLRIMLATHHRLTHPVQESEDESVATSANSEHVVYPANRPTSSNQCSDVGNAEQEAITRTSAAEAIQTRIAAEEKVIETKLREATQLEARIKGHKLIVEKVTELTGSNFTNSGTGQTSQVDAFTAEYVVLRIDAEKGAIATKEKNLEILREEVQSLQMKVEAWKLLLE